MPPKLYENDRAIVGPRGELVFDGVDLGRLARERETPFFLISQEILEQNYRRLLQGFSTIKDFGVYYSVKTNFESGVLQTLRGLGAGAEISGDLDLHVVLKAGFSPDQIVFDGPCKTDRELEHAIERRIRIINVESVDEIRRVDALGRAHGRVIDIGVRLDPMTRRPYYDKLITTYKQKFGFRIADSAEAFAAIRACRNVRLIGLHAHIGSQIMNPALYVEALTALFRLTADLRRSGLTIEEINIGGGFPAQSLRALRLARRVRGARLLERLQMLEKRIPSTEDFGRTISECYHTNSRAHGLAPRLTVEPGRMLVNNACVLVGRVRLLKPNWVFTDMSHNEMPENLFFTEWRVFFPDKMTQPLVSQANVSGPTLSTYDVLFFQKEIPALEVGDPVAIFDMGGYAIPRANQFTRPRSGVYFLRRDGDLRLIRRRETVEDVVRMQVWDRFPGDVDPEAIPAPAVKGLSETSR
jgi:diaminopimelate decarboxylase